MASRPSLSLSLSALRTFEAVARCGGLKAAAGELGLTVSAISHQLQGLEGAFGAPLFERAGRRLLPTGVGADLARDLGPAFASIDAALERVRRRRSTLTVSLQPSLAAKWLLPRLRRFEKIVPDLDIRLATTTRLVDLGQERIDCAIRLGPGGWPGVSATWLAPQLKAPFAHRSLARPETAARVMLDGRADEWAPWRDLKTGPMIRILESRDLVIDAVLSGVGVGVIDTLMAAGEVARGEVVALAPPQRTRWSYFFVVDEAAAASPHATAFTAWIKSELATAEQRA